MKITREQLIEKDACSEGLLWFREEFGEEAELEELKKTLGLMCRSIWLEWLFQEFALSGVVICFYLEGPLLGCGHYKDGKLHGLYEAWYRNGQLAYRYNFKDGEFHGLYQLWDDSGHLALRLYYYNGSLQTRRTRLWERIMRRLTCWKRSGTL